MSFPWGVTWTGTGTLTEQGRLLLGHTPARLAPPCPLPCSLPLLFSATMPAKAGWVPLTHPQRLASQPTASPFYGFTYSREHARKKGIRLRLALGKFTNHVKRHPALARAHPRSQQVTRDSPRFGPTGNYLATADSSTRLAGSYPRGSGALPRQAPREQERTPQPAGTPNTCEEAAAWQERAGREKVTLPSGSFQSPWG